MRYANLFLNFKNLNSSVVLTAKRKQISSREILKEFQSSLPLTEFVFDTKNAEIESAVYKIGIL